MSEVRPLTICINGWLLIAFLKNIKKCVTPLSNGDVRFKLPINQVEESFFNDDEQLLTIVYYGFNYIQAQSCIIFFHYSCGLLITSSLHASRLIHGLNSLFRGKLMYKANETKYFFSKLSPWQNCIIGIEYFET